MSGNEFRIGLAFCQISSEKLEKPFSLDTNVTAEVKTIHLGHSNFSTKDSCSTVISVERVYKHILLCIASYCCHSAL